MRVFCVYVCVIHHAPQINVIRIFQQILVIRAYTAFLKFLVVGILMVSFMCQPDWALGRPDCWANVASRCVCEGVSGRD